MLLDDDIDPIDLHELVPLDSSSQDTLVDDEATQPAKDSLLNGCPSKSTRRRTKPKEAPPVPPPPLPIAQYKAHSIDLQDKLPEGGYFDKIKPPAFNPIISNSLPSKPIKIFLAIVPSTLINQWVI